MTSFTRPPPAHYYAYRIARGEQGVLTYEPYKSHLLPLWRFRTVPIALTSSSALYSQFESFYAQQDFVGMDMARKFIQMGMTRAKRYANHKGGRKYVDGKERGNLIEKSKGHEGKEEKEEASGIFKGVWEKCRAHEGYGRLKGEWLREQRAWREEHGDVKDDVEVKKMKGEEKDEVVEKEEVMKQEKMNGPSLKRTRRKVKKEEESQDKGVKPEEVDEPPPKGTRRTIKKESH